MRRFALPVLALLWATASAAADDVRPSDTVVLKLTAEGWVETATAEVTVAADAASGGGDAGQARDELIAAIRALAPAAEWRLIRMEPSTDAAGLARWLVVASARVAEGDLAALHERARETSRPGLQLRVESVNFEPSVAEVEAVRARLREEIYRRARAELEAVNRVLEDRSFRIGAVEFIDAGLPEPIPVPKMARTEAMAMPMDAGGLETVSEKLRLDARVVLRAEPPAPSP